MPPAPPRSESDRRSPIRSRCRRSPCERGSRPPVAFASTWPVSSSVLWLIRRSSRSVPRTLAISASSRPTPARVSTSRFVAVSARQSSLPLAASWVSLRVSDPFAVAGHLVEQVVDGIILPGFRTGRRIDSDAAPRRGAETELGHELRHQFELLVGNREPG